MSRAGLASSLSVVGNLHVGPPPFPQSPGQTDFLVPMPGSGGLGVPVAMRSTSCSGASIPAWNLARADLALSVPGNVQLDPISFSHSRGRMGLAASVLAFAHVDISVVLQSSSCPGPVTPAAGLSRLGPCFSPLVIERVNLGVFLFLHSPVRPDPAVAVFAFAHVGFVASPRSFQCVGLLVPACGLSRLESTPLVLGGSSADLSAFLRSPAQLGAALPALRLAHMGSSLPLHGPGQPSASLLVIGATCLGSVFLLLVIESSQLDSSLLLRTSACLGPTAAVLRETHLELPMPLQSFGRSGASVPTSGMS